ncbi:MAG TPA: NAD(P)/FAD-dependent oxidoreductase, partial [Patescibacteria group bacterium]|nr:NAD(P)/FAD-dependent oxidoreductase [Patescibacteria group bacterium]
MARKTKFDYDLIVIGSGAAGSTAALSVARAGKKVALVEAGVFGGESPNYGDVPTKAVLHAAALYGEARDGQRFGIRSSMLGYNFPTIQAWKQKAIKRSGSANNREYYTRAGIDTFDGIAHFLTPHEITVNRKHLTADTFFVATGAQFAQPDVYGIDTIRYQTPRTILDTKRIPRTLFIVGSDPEALEYAQVFATFGTKVYVSERAARILPSFDSSVSELFEKHFAQTLGINFLTQTQLAGVEPKGLGVRVSFTRGETTKAVQVDEILFLDRSPVTDLGLENAHVDYTPAGVDVDDHLRTTAQHVFAGGAAIDSGCTTQTAMLHGRIVAQTLLAKKPVRVPDTAPIPRVIHTNPTVASVGLTDDDCLKRDLSTNMSLVPLSQVARA